MALDLDGAYAQIKALENTGQIAIPEPRETVPIGIIDPAAGTFSWSVPTIVQTLVIPPHPPVRTNTIINTTVGVVATTAVDLRLRFAVIPQQRQAVFESRRARRSARADAAAGSVISELWNGGVTISGYPTVSATPNEITVDVGHDCSTIIHDAPNLTPPVTRFGVTINFLDHPSIDVSFFALRPSVLGMGAFTLPALPMTIVYAPPQGQSKQNKAAYSDTETLTRTITSSLSTSRSTKTAEAYSASDLLGKATAAIASVAAVVGTGGAAGGPTVVGALEQLGEAVFGPIKSENDSISGALTQAKDELSALGTIVQGLAPTTTSSDEVSIKTEDDHSVTLSVSALSQYEAKAGLGPGVGDRIVFLNDVRVVWMAIQGEVNLVILGYEKIVATAVDDLQQALQTIAAGGQSPLGLDAETIKYLLGLDPLATPPGPHHIAIGPGVHFGPPVIGRPRFVPADPPGRAGTGTGADGDVFEASYDTATDDVHTTTSAHTTITDVKPGWIPVLFGADDNVETTTTTTFTTTQTTDNKSEDKITTTITLFSQGNNDPYDVRIFYDRTFGTYLILAADSPLLHGVSVNEMMATA